MARIVFIGAGSYGFTRALVRDVLTFPLLRDATLVLMDINKERLEFARKACEAIIKQGNYPATIVTTMNRREALRGADAVLCTILNGGVDIWKHDILIPKKYGIDTNVGDTRSVSGVFRALRTIPVMVSIAKDMEECCPNAILLNYTNPMAMLCRAMQRESFIKTTGLCHSVQGTAEMLAKWIKADMKDVTYTCAGINHQAFYLDFKVKGKDAYPRIHKAVTGDKKIYNAEQVRNEMYLALDYYVTESSGHNSEYNWWFRKRPDLIAKYCTKGTNWNPGHYAYILDGYTKNGKDWKKNVKAWLKKGAPIDLARGHEYAAYIINAWMGGELYSFSGNVANTKLIDNLKEGCCVEVPVLVDRRGFSPIHVGPLPPQLAALNQVSVSVEEMAVEAALTGDPRLVYQAICFDPLSAAVLSLAEIKKMVQEMLLKNKPLLPRFKKLQI
ncbi:MAG: alpha-galactosidase [Kiritimatiellia bacterium]